jgi:hypothetical protein
MRVLIGIFLGILLTVSVAYIHDASITAPSTNPNYSSNTRPMVNWDVAGKSWEEFKTRVDIGWKKLQSLG